MSVPVKPDAFSRSAKPSRARKRASIALVAGERGRPEIAMPPGDATRHEARLLTALGSPSRAFARAELQRLVAISRTAPGSDPDEDAMNAALAVIDGIEPRNEHEALLAAQIAAAHLVAMEAAARTRYALTVHDAHEAKQFGTVAARLMRATARLTEAMTRLRRGGVQQVIVQHVTVSDSAQVAILNQGGEPK